MAKAEALPAEETTLDEAVSQPEEVVEGVAVEGVITSETEVETGTELATTDEEAATCIMCNKPLTANESVERGIGPVCASRLDTFLESEDYEGKPPDWRNLEYPVEKLDELVELAVGVTSFDTFAPDEDEEEALEETHVPIGEVLKAIDKADKTRSSFVRAMGGDRRRNDPEAPHWAPLYFQGKRWLPKEALDHIGDLNDKPSKKPKEEKSKEKASEKKPTSKKTTTKKPAAKKTEETASK